MVTLTPTQRKKLEKISATLDAMYARNEQILAMLDRRERIPESMLKPIRM